ncbi:Ubiquitin fusion degradation protein 4 [Microbotryomycetes sp. JL221]|nr:Ubiquitin fusion degradation protein 4 [Microbotryomycetes sp. JL221]
MRRSSRRQSQQQQNNTSSTPLTHAADSSTQSLTAATQSSTSSKRRKSVTFNDQLVFDKRQLTTTTDRDDDRDESTTRDDQDSPHTLPSTRPSTSSSSATSKALGKRKASSPPRDQLVASSSRSRIEPSRVERDLNSKRRKTNYSLRPRSSSTTGSGIGTSSVATDSSSTTTTRTSLKHPSANQSHRTKVVMPRKGVTAGSSKSIKPKRTIGATTTSNRFNFNDQDDQDDFTVVGSKHGRNKNLSSYRTQDEEDDDDDMDVGRRYGADDVMSDNQDDDDDDDNENDVVMSNLVGSSSSTTTRGRTNKNNVETSSFKKKNESSNVMDVSSSSSVGRSSTRRQRSPFAFESTESTRMTKDIPNTVRDGSLATATTSQQDRHDNNVSDESESDDVNDDETEDNEEEQNSQNHYNQEEEDDDDDDDEEESEDYETELRPDGSIHDEYGDSDGGDGSDLMDVPQRFDVGDDDEDDDHDDEDDDGEGMLSRSAMDEAAALFGAAAAAATGGRAAGSDGATGTGGGAGGAFRALQGLMSGMTSRFKQLLTKLKDEKTSISTKLITLQDLSELLSVSTEDTLAGYFQTESFVKEFVNILRGDKNGLVVEGGIGGTGAGGATHSSGMTEEEMIAFGLDPIEMMSGQQLDAQGTISEEDNVQMMLLACRCLANLMEALPGSAHSVVYAGAVPVLCSKLLEIQYIDLAEQTLSTLEKISEEAPSSIVREGGLNALLSFLDFFSFHVQRTAVTAAANCCRSLSLESFSMVQDVMPIFRNILSYPDQRVVEQACLAIVRIVDSYRHYPDKLDNLMSRDLLTAVKSLLNPDSTTVGPSTYSQMLKMLSTSSRTSPQIAISLVELDIANTLYHLLTSVAAPEFESDKGPQVVSNARRGEADQVDNTLGDDLLVVQSLVQRPKEQVQETLNLICEILPPLPKDGVFDNKAFTDKGKTKVKREDSNSTIHTSTSTTAVPNVTAADTSVTSINADDVKMESIDDSVLDTASTSNTKASRPKTSSRLSSRSGSRVGKSRSKQVECVPTKDELDERRVNSFTVFDQDDQIVGLKRKLVVNRFYALLLPILVDVCLASVNGQVRGNAVLGLLKMVNFCPVDELMAILNNVSMASFLAALLSTKDNSTLTINALQLVELLLVRMPDAYQYHFRREGVMHEIELIANNELLSASKSKKSSPSRTPAEGGSGNVESKPTESGLGRALRMHAVGTSSSIKKALTPFEIQTQDSITLRARHLLQEYGSLDSAAAVRARTALDNVTQLVQDLDDFVNSKTNVEQLEQQAHELSSRVVGLFSKESETLSSFELLESGLVQGLLQFTSSEGTNGVSCQRRQELLADALFSCPQLGGSKSAAALLVKRLQESLSRMEQFEVQLATSGISDFDSRRTGPAMLARQLKLRLVAEDGSDIPKSCSNIVVSIHAIATFQAFNDYLRPRILAAQSDRPSASSLAALLGIGSSSGGGTAESGVGGSRNMSSSSATLSSSASMSQLNHETSNVGASSSTPRLSSSLGAPASTSAKIFSNIDDADNVESSKPARRRSRRLSGKGIEGEDDTAEDAQDKGSKGKAAGSNAVSDEEEDHMVAQNEAYEDSNESTNRTQDALFADDLQSSTAQRDERPVNLEVADDKVVPKTPDGTRVGTPNLSQTPGNVGSAATSGTIAGPESSTSASETRPSAPKPRASYAAALKAEPTDFHLEFTIGDQPVDLDTTVYGAVHKNELRTPEHSRRNIWHSIVEVKFRKVAGPARSNQDDERHVNSPFTRKSQSVLEKMPPSIPSDSQQANILKLLWVLHKLNAEFVEQKLQQQSSSSLTSSTLTGLSEVAFVNNKLTAKLNRQLEEPMIVASACLPDWSIDLPVCFPFLFPFETRYTFLQSTAFGYARLMQKWVGQTRTDNSSSRRDENLGFLGRLPRQKVRISRERILDSAIKVFELYGSSRASLEVEFFSEVGSGLGPTLEFYALVSKEFAKKDLKLWRDESHDSSSAFVHSSNGLFPAPMGDADSDEGQKRIKSFRVLGQFVAKALMDSRIIDVHFSRIFMRLVLDHKLPSTIATVRAIDKDLGSSLAHLQALSDKRRSIEADQSQTSTDRKNHLAAVATSVTDLTLDFTLPGFNIELKQGGRDLSVDIDNLDEYISLVVDWTTDKGVERLVEAFKAGFSNVFSVRDMQSFTPSELVMLTSALDEDWTVECLTNSTKADHGFTMDSRPVKDLISIMSEFSLNERREFLSFTTGSPRLPIGGFAALTPPLTIVRKDGGDGSLFSTMTCANFLKLPNYSSRQVVKERVLFAIREGQGGFHLS